MSAVETVLRSGTQCKKDVGSDIVKSGRYSGAGWLEHGRQEPNRA